MASCYSTHITSHMVTLHGTARTCRSGADRPNRRRLAGAQEEGASSICSHSIIIGADSGVSLLAHLITKWLPASRQPAEQQGQHVSMSGVGGVGQRSGYVYILGGGQSVPALAAA